MLCWRRDSLCKYRFFLNTVCKNKADKEAEGWKPRTNDTISVCLQDYLQWGYRHPKPQLSDICLPNRCEWWWFCFLLGRAGSICISTVCLLLTQSSTLTLAPLFCSGVATFRQNMRSTWWSIAATFQCLSLIILMILSLFMQETTRTVLSIQ